MGTCSIEGCGRSVKARGLCDKHYLKARRGGDLALFSGPGRGRYAPETSRTCPGVSECGKKECARGLCNSCYQIRRSDGSLPRLPKVNAGQRCRVNECVEDPVSLGYCGSHYRRFKLYGDPLASAPRKTGGDCRTDGCVGVVVADGLCRNCYGRRLKRGSVEYSDKYLKRFKNVLDDKGYVLAPVPSHMNAKTIKRVREHRLVMASYLGRDLRENENVHHKNGIKSDNRLENLELWVSSQPSGQRPTDLMAWARSLLKLYVPDERKLKRLQYRNL